MKTKTKNSDFNNNLVSEHIALPYRRGVGLMVLNKKKEIFLGKRIDTKNSTWQMPQGGIKDDETVIEAGLRELYEETNMEDIEVIAETQNWLYYDLPEFLVEKLWEGQYRGQKQKWLLINFLGTESSIDISKSTAEFKKWQWMEIDKVPSIATPFKKHLYSLVLKEFHSAIHKL